MQQVEKLDLNLLPNNVYGQISCSMQAKTNGGVKRSVQWATREQHAYSNSTDNNGPSKLLKTII